MPMRARRWIWLCRRMRVRSRGVRRVWLGVMGDVQRNLPYPSISTSTPRRWMPIRKGVRVMQFPCHACGKMGESRMCITDIPYFKEVISLRLRVPHQRSECSRLDSPADQVRSRVSVSSFVWMRNTQLSVSVATCSRAVLPRSSLFPEIPLIWRFQKSTWNWSPVHWAACAQK